MHVCIPQRRLTLFPPNLLPRFILDGFLICHVFECGLAPNPTSAQVGMVLNEALTMHADGDVKTITLSVAVVSCFTIST